MWRGGKRRRRRRNISGSGCEELVEFIDSVHVNHYWLSFCCTQRWCWFLSTTPGCFCVVNSFLSSFCIPPLHLQSRLQLMLHLFELYFVSISKSFLFLVEHCLYVTCDPGFVIGETADSLCRYDCISTEVDVLQSVHSKQSLRASLASGVHFLTVRVVAGFVTGLQKNQVVSWLAQWW